MRNLILFAIAVGTLHALPELDRVFEGHRAALEIQDQTLEVSLGKTNTSVIDWKSFSIDHGEKVRFTFPSSASAILNRVTGNARSEIFGHLESNGIVYLINPQGILFGKDSVVDVGSLIASTHIPNLEDFLVQRNVRFCSKSDASIVNLGTICANNGPLVLIASQIRNEGILSAASQIALATGKKLLLQPGNTPLLSIELGGAGAIEQMGTISAPSVELQAASNPYSLAICMQGFVDATQVENVGGEIYLRAEGSVEIAETAHLRGDKIDIKTHGTRALFQKGTLEARDIQIETDQLYHAGTLLAKEGGAIAIRTNAYMATSRASVDVSGRMHGGTITIDAPDSFFSSGTYRANGREGGTIAIDSNRIHFAAATVSAEGRVRGGEIAIFSRSG